MQHYWYCFPSRDRRRRKPAVDSSPISISPRSTRCCDMRCAERCTRAQHLTFTARDAAGAHARTRQGKKKKKKKKKKKRRGRVPPVWHGGLYYRPLSKPNKTSASQYGTPEEEARRTSRLVRACQEEWYISISVPRFARPHTVTHLAPGAYSLEYLAAALTARRDSQKASQHRAVRLHLVSRAKTRGDALLPRHDALAGWFSRRTAPSARRPCYHSARISQHRAAPAWLSPGLTGAAPYG